MYQGNHLSYWENCKFKMPKSTHKVWSTKIHLVHKILWSYGHTWSYNLTTRCSTANIYLKILKDWSANMPSKTKPKFRNQYNISHLTWPVIIKCCSYINAALETADKKKIIINVKIKWSVTLAIMKNCSPHSSAWTQMFTALNYIFFSLFDCIFKWLIQFNNHSNFENLLLETI